MGNNNYCKDYQKDLSNSKDCFSRGTVAKEKKKTFLIEKSDKTEQFLKIQVDDCLISDPDTIKCDYSFIRCKTGEIYFVELKGQNIDHAVDQIEATIDHFKAKIPSLSNQEISGYIVSSGVTTKANASFSRRKKRFLDKYGTELRKESFKLVKRV